MTRACTSCIPSTWSACRLHSSSGSSTVDHCESTLRLATDCSGRCALQSSSSRLGCTGSMMCRCVCGLDGQAHPPQASLCDASWSHDDVHAHVIAVSHNDFRILGRPLKPRAPLRKAGSRAKCAAAQGPQNSLPSSSPGWGATCRPTANEHDARAQPVTVVSENLPVTPLSTGLARSSPVAHVC
jgi:hypothetical protein